MCASTHLIWLQETRAPATDLRITRYPSMDEEEELGEYGLFLTEDPETPGPHLHFNQTWSPEAVDAWVRRLAPKLFAYMDARYGVREGPGRDQFHWVLARRNRNQLVRARKPTAINGADLHRVRGSGRSVNHYSLVFGKPIIAAEVATYLDYFQ